MYLGNNKREKNLFKLSISVDLIMDLWKLKFVKKSEVNIS